MQGDIVVQQISEADAVQYRVDRQIDIIHDERAIDFGMDRPAFLLKLPAKDRAIGEAVADAIVILQILRG